MEVADGKLTVFPQRDFPQARKELKTSARLGGRLLCILLPQQEQESK